LSKLIPVISDIQNMATLDGLSTVPSSALPSNRRREFRKVVLRDGILTPCDDEAADAYRVVVVDIASLGVGMRSQVPLPDGAVFNLSIPSKPEYDTARVRVVHSQPGKGAQFHVGAEFC
jgi:hypothetical protein